MPNYDSRNRYAGCRANDLTPSDCGTITLYYIRYLFSKHKEKNK